MCKNIFENKDVWEKDISNLLLDLAYDKIINVRISLAKFISKIILKGKFNYLKNDDTIKKIVSILRKDKDEVSNIVKNLDVENVSVELGVKVNEKFVDNMEFVSKEFGITNNVPLNSKVNFNKKDNDSEIPTSTGTTDNITIQDKKEEEKKEEDKKDEEKKEEEKKEEEKKEEEKKEEEKKEEEKKTAVNRLRNRSKGLRKLLSERNKEKTNILRKYFFKFLSNGILLSLKKTTLRSSKTLTSIDEGGNKDENNPEDKKEEEESNWIIEEKKRRKLEEEQRQKELWEKKSKKLIVIFNKKDQILCLALRSSLQKWNLRAKILAISDLTIGFRKSKRLKGRKKTKRYDDDKNKDNEEKKEDENEEKKEDN